MVSSAQNLSPEERAQLLAELKRRLEEINAIKRALGMSENESLSEEKKTPAFSSTPPSNPSLATSSKKLFPTDVQSALEELVVPPLEMLDDRPLIKKKQSTY